MKDSHIGRRQFVRYSAAGIAAVASAKAWRKSRLPRRNLANTSTTKRRKKPMCWSSAGEPLGLSRRFRPLVRGAEPSWLKMEVCWAAQ